MVDQRSIGVALLYCLLLLLFESAFGQQVQQQQQRLSSGIELTALFELRSSLGLRSKDWPRKVDPCSNWTGISCANGSVIRINISGFRRTRLGRLNPQFAVNSLANFTNLISFNASKFLLPGSIPDWFGQRLLTLQVLDLSSCSVIGVIPLSIGNMTNLTSLYLSNNRLTGQIPATLGQLLSLSVLDLSSNSLAGSIPSSFGSLRNLTSLDISSNNLTGPIPLGIGVLSKLQSLNLSSNSLTSSIPAQLGDLRSLVDLDLSSNGLSGSVPQDLRGLRNLQRMKFENNSLGGSLPVNLFPSPSQLQVIVLRNNNFSGDLPEVLWSIPGLNVLDISHNNFTGKLPSNSASNGSATAAELDISQNKFYGGLTSVLSSFTSTDLSGNYFEGRVPDYVNENASLSRNCLQNVTDQRTLTDCSSFYSARGLIFDNFGRPNSTEPPVPESGKSNRNTIILAAVLGGVGLIVVLIVLLLLVSCARRRSTTNHRGIGVGPVPAGEGTPSPGVAINFSSLGDLFTYQQLLQATGDFSDANLIKHGHSGDLFRGVLEGGLPIVVKRIDLQSIKKEADVQASSILLDDKFEVRLGSLSEVCAQEGDGHQNRITRLLRLPQTSEQGSSGSSTALCAYDVYCFGKVLLGLVTGKLDTSSDTETKEWFEQTLPYISIYDKELVTKILDPSLMVDEDLLEEVWAMAIVARSCLNPKPSRRPLMRYILKALENPLRVVREDNSGSARLRTTSSRGSWNAALFGSWRQSSSDVAVIPAASTTKAEGGSSFKHSGTTGSHNGSGDHSSSRRRHSREICPEPPETQDIERQDRD
ncbi:hypothetical protein CCACVL1_02007 [Corchorus capsularis]|uniref:Uncharacterized protein n=1 Tax=Corchorus capsularis TaxID=210143 RepID=A0A1R3KDN1_COCAP|nr:hypothetical protein CCACVL1_02007 [Corchorus capsularis]